jgi:hypothetical protein
MFVVIVVGGVDNTPTHSTYNSVENRRQKTLEVLVEGDIATLQYTATARHCKALQDTARHCKTLQHTLQMRTA